jgi:ABC-type multidrug transport system ATPase subunit
MAEYRVLFLDEPCSVPDPVARERFLEMIERIGGVEQAPILVLVTHHVEEITPAFIHVLMMKKGRVLPLGRRDRVMTSENLKRLFDENGALEPISKLISSRSVAKSFRVRPQGKKPRKRTVRTLRSFFPENEIRELCSTLQQIAILR